MGVKAFLTYLESECDRSPRTLVTYRTCLEDFRDFLDRKGEGTEWGDVDQDLVRDWMVELMERGNTPRTVCKKLSALKTFYRFLLQRQMVDRDPVHTLQGPRQEKSLPVFVRETEMDELLDGNYFEDTPEGRRDRLVLLILYSTGLRRSELCGLDWKDVDMGQRQMKVTGKRNKQRIVPFGEELLKAMNACRDDLRDLPGGTLNTTAVVVNLKRGTRLTDWEVYRIVRHYLSYVGNLKKRSPHVLRHSFATVMLNNQANLQSVKELLGHENLATTEVYTHTTFEELKRMYNQAHPRAK